MKVQFCVQLLLNFVLRASQYNTAFRESRIGGLNIQGPLLKYFDKNQTILYGLKDALKLPLASRVR